MKYIFYIVVILFLYRTLFRPKIIVEHRHKFDRKPKENPTKDLDYTEYEELK